jgi:hypothetical protein
VFRHRAPAPATLAPGWPRLLAVTATCLALFTVVFAPARPAEPAFAPDTPRWTILAASNQWLASYFISESRAPVNSLPLQRFEWTNHQPSPSSSFLPR